MHSPVGTTKFAMVLDTNRQGAIEAVTKAIACVMNRSNGCTDRGWHRSLEGISTQAKLQQVLQGAKDVWHCPFDMVEYQIKVLQSRKICYCAWECSGEVIEAERQELDSALRITVYKLPIASWCSSEPISMGEPAPNLSACRKGD